MTAQTLRRPGPAVAPLDAKALASGKREALRRRTRRIRRSVAGFATALFAAAFMTVYVQLASGHDPALTANAARRAAQSEATSGSNSVNVSSGGESSTGSASGGESSGETSGESGESTNSESSNSVSAVTTSQS